MLYQGYLYVSHKKEAKDTMKTHLADQIGTMLNTNGDSGSLDQEDMTTRGKKESSESIRHTREGSLQSTRQMLANFTFVSFFVCSTTITTTTYPYMMY